MPQKSEDVVMPYGKYSGRSLGDILATDPAYLDWLNGTEIRRRDLKEAVAAMNETYAPEIERALED